MDDESWGTQEEPMKKTREKSVRYPANDLKECVDFLSIVHSIGGRKDAPIESILSKLNLTSSETKSFRYLVSSSEIFGFIEKTNGGIKPTEFGTLILYPPEGEDQKRQLLVDAFKIPQLYQKIIERYDNMILPNNVILRNVFLHLGIAPKALDNAVEAFINSAQYANVIDSSNRLRITNTDKKTASPSKPSELASEDLKLKSTFSQLPVEDLGDLQKKSTDYHKFEFIISTGKKAYVQIPMDCKKEDLEKLKKILDAVCGD
jgi:hypothetical protein